jgi:hypothetical protein
MVFMSSKANILAVFGPIPQSLSTGRGDKKTRSWPGGTIVIPLGLLMPEATLATDLEVAKPMLHVSPVSARTRRFTFTAMLSGGLFWETWSVMSRKASSNDNGSISGVISLKIAIICLDVWRYTSNRGSIRIA